MVNWLKSLMGRTGRASAVGALAAMAMQPPTTFGLPSMGTRIEETARTPAKAKAARKRKRLLKLRKAAINKQRRLKRRAA